MTSPGYEGVLTALNSPGTYTVFAPTNDAFAGAGLNVTEVEFVTSVLQYHVLGSVVKSTDLTVIQFPETIMTNSKYVTLGGKGQVLDIYTSPKGVFIYFRDMKAQVVLADVMCSNGVVHVIDKVIMLPLETAHTAKYSGLKTLVSAVVRTNLVDAIDNTAGITIFAPTNAAFEKIGGIDQLTDEQLAKVLTYHVVPAVAYGPDVKTGSLPTLEGDTLSVVASWDPQTGEKIMVNDAEVVLPNVLVKNGVVHVIDRVLLPPDFQL